MKTTMAMRACRVATPPRLQPHVFCLFCWFLISRIFSQQVAEAAGGCTSCASLSPSSAPKRAPGGFSQCDEPCSVRSLVWHRDRWKPVG